jgi:hypothetical protein
MKKVIVFLSAVTSVLFVFYFSMLQFFQKEDRHAESTAHAINALHT